MLVNRKMQCTKVMSSYPFIADKCIALTMNGHVYMHNTYISIVEMSRLCNIFWLTDADDCETNSCIHRIDGNKKTRKRTNTHAFTQTPYNAIVKRVYAAKCTPLNFNDGPLSNNNFLHKFQFHGGEIIIKTHTHTHTKRCKLYLFSVTGM